MKATGIVRRIDDLGRVVIPKEIRRTMRIREGDPLEIFTNREGEVIFKKYSPIGELNRFAAEYAETLYKTCELSVVICDRDAVIAVAGAPKKEYVDHRVSAELEHVISARSLYTWRRGEKRMQAVEDARSGHVISCAMPIITEGDIIGCVVSLTAQDSTELPGEMEVKLIQTAAGFLSRQLES